MDTWIQRDFAPEPNKRKNKPIIGPLFSIPFIGAILHNDQTRQALETVDNRTAFIRNSIINYAANQGFSLLKQGSKRPNYIDTNLWTELLKTQKKGYYVDYNYVIAFYWLLAKPEYQSYNKSRLIRLILS